jgi:hypothetical protein
VVDLERRIDGHWAEVVLAAARAGDPYAYGKERFDRAHRTLRDRARTTDGDAAEQNLADLERAVLVSPPAQTFQPKAVTDRTARLRDSTDWAQLAHDQSHQRDHGRGLGIGR